MRKLHTLDELRQFIADYHSIGHKEFDEKWQTTSSDTDNGPDLISTLGKSLDVKPARKKKHHWDAEVYPTYVSNEQLGYNPLRSKWPTVRKLALLELEQHQKSPARKKRRTHSSPRVSQTK